MNEPATDVPPWATMSTLAEASDTGLLDIRRLGDMLARIEGRIIHQRLDARFAARRAGDARDRPRAWSTARLPRRVLAEAEADLVKDKRPWARWAGGTASQQRSRVNVTGVR